MSFFFYKDRKSHAHRRGRSSRSLDSLRVRRENERREEGEWELYSPVFRLEREFSRTRCVRGSLRPFIVVVLRRVSECWKFV